MYKGESRLMCCEEKTEKKLNAAFRNFFFKFVCIVKEASSIFTFTFVLNTAG
jgi:hypothetical protein